MTPFDRLVTFIFERERIRVRKEKGEPWPWTEDPILLRYKFCNVRRNDDVTTKQIHDGWLKPHNGDPDVWFAMTVARLVNWWPSLHDLGYPVPWDRPRFKKVLGDLRERGAKVFTGAYMVRADAVLTGSKVDYLADFVLQPMWESRDSIRPHGDDTLATFHARLMRYRDMGSFMAGQIVADVKYANGSPLFRAEDWTTWAAPGPGSLRGLNRVLGNAKNSKFRKGEWEEDFSAFLPELNAKLAPDLAPLTGQDAQNCLCEFDKYERVLKGEGRPRSMYFPKEP